MLVPLDWPESSICNRYSIEMEAPLGLGVVGGGGGGPQVMRIKPLTFLLSPTVGILLFPPLWKLIIQFDLTHYWLSEMRTREKNLVSRISYLNVWLPGQLRWCFKSLSFLRSLV